MSDSDERTITEIFEDLGHGQTALELERQLQNVVRAVRETAKVGTVSLKMKIKPNGEEAVSILSEVDSKAPVKPLGESSFYANSKGHLGKRPPGQTDMFDDARDVSAPNQPTGKIRSIQ